MGGQVHGPNLGMAPRLGYRRSDEDTEQNERSVEEEWEDETVETVIASNTSINQVSSKKSSVKSTAVPAWSSARRNARRNGKSPGPVSQEDWKTMNEMKYRQADITYHKSSKTRAEADKLRTKEEAQALTLKEKAEHRLKERLEETLFWSQELHNEIQAWELEKQDMKKARKDLIQVHRQTCRPAKLTDKCIRTRENRIGSDKVLDQVEENLIMELENIRLWQFRFKMAIEQMEFQESENNGITRELSRELRTMTRAATIDSTCTQLNKKNNRLQLHTGVDIVALPGSWEIQTQNKIADSRKVREWSQQLRADIETLVRSACVDLVNRWKKTNESLKDNIECLDHSITKLRSRQDATVKEIEAQNKEIDKLKSSLAAKGPCLKLAQTRLNMRTQRSVRSRGAWEEVDSSQAVLISEVTTILDNIQLLNQQLRKVEGTLKELIGVKTKLDYDIQVKTTSLQIDSIKCLSERTKYPMKLKDTWQKVLEAMEKNEEREVEKRRLGPQDSEESELRSLISSSYD